MLPFIMGSAGATAAGQLGIGAAGSGMSAAGLGSILGGSGALLGGISGFFGGSSGGYRGRDHKQSIKNEMKSRMRYARRFGEQYGFHPLTALGISPGSTPMQAQGQSSTGRGLATMGQALGRISKTGMSEMQQAQLENVQAHTRLLNSQANNVEKGSRGLNLGSDTPISSVASPPNLYSPLPMPQQAPGGGRQLGEKGAEVINWTPEGNLITQPSEGLEDLVSEDINAKIRFYAPHWERMVKGWATHAFKSNQNTVAGVRFRNATRLYLVGLEKSHPPPPGMMYVWNNKAGTVARVRRQKFHRLFKNSTKYGMQVEFYSGKGKKSLLKRYREYFNRKMHPLQKAH